MSAYFLHSHCLTRALHIRKISKSNPSITTSKAPTNTTYFTQRPRLRAAYKTAYPRLPLPLYPHLSPSHTHTHTHEPLSFSFSLQTANMAAQREVNERGKESAREFECVCVRVCVMCFHNRWLFPVNIFRAVSLI